MENYSNSDPNQQPTQNPKPDRNQLMYIIIACLALALGVALYFVFKKDKKVNDHTAVVQTDSAKVVQDTIRKDTLQTKVTTEYEEGEGDYEPYSESFVIANDAFLRNAPSQESQAGSLKFGDRVWIDNSKSQGQYATVYLSKPQKNAMPQTYYVTESVLVRDYEFDKYKKYFSLGPFAKLASKTKKLILDNDYSKGTSYAITQNAERAKSTVCYGDFDGDGVTDVAVLMDNNEQQSSRILIICTNAATKDPYLAFAEDYSDRMKINSFKKGASVIMNSAELISSPHDGVIVKGDDVKLALIFDSNSQKFKTYYQE